MKTSLRNAAKRTGVKKSATTSPATHLYGDDTKSTTDASHASDLGFMRQADVFEPVIRQALGEVTLRPALGSGFRR